MNSKPLILVVDDDKDILQCVADFLDFEGYDVITAEDGIYAWEMLTLQGRRPALLLTDIMMPIMNGFELVKRIRAHDELKTLPVICFTASRTIKERLGGCEAVQKPFDIEEISRVIKDLLTHNKEQLCDGTQNLPIKQAKTHQWQL
jgi:DNA-binding response OmpR family regulator